MPDQAQARQRLAAAEPGCCSHCICTYAHTLTAATVEACLCLVSDATIVQPSGHPDMGCDTACLHTPTHMLLLDGHRLDGSQQSDAAIAMLYHGSLALR